MRKLFFGSCLFLLFFGMLVNYFSLVYAADESVDEDKLFSGGSTVDEDDKVSDQIEQELQKRHFGISGEINTDSDYINYTSPYFWTDTFLEDGLQNTISADLFLDLRFTDGVKIFVSLEGYFYPEGTFESYNLADKIYNDVLLKECFLDTNWKNKVYFRWGKQVLKWGTGYFWNPTDLVNVEKKDFYDLDKNPEGTNGVKVHIPFGVKRNIYFFAGMEDTECIEDISLSFKYEWLVGKSEMSLSTWYKDGKYPVFGYDFSTRINKLDCQGEISLSDGYDAELLEYNSTTGAYEQCKVDGWYPQVSIGFTRYFDYGDINDRISLVGEFFYNGAGYDTNIYQQINKTTVAEKSLLKAILANQYESFTNSKYYFALFGTMKKFLISEFTLNFNVINNLVDHSYCIMTGINYEPHIKDWSLNFNVYQYLGDSYSETKLMGQTYVLNFGITVPFSFH